MFERSLYLLLPLAQGGEAPAQPNIFIQLLPMFLLFGGLYFLMIAPQRKKQKEHARMLEGLKRGDQIVTTGGIYGEIASIKEDRFMLKIADNTRVELNRNFIQSKVTPDGEK